MGSPGCGSLLLNPSLWALAGEWGEEGWAVHWAVGSMGEPCPLVWCPLSALAKVQISSVQLVSWAAAQILDDPCMTLGLHCLIFKVGPGTPSSLGTLAGLTGRNPVAGVWPGT